MVIVEFLYTDQSDIIDKIINDYGFMYFDNYITDDYNYIISQDDIKKINIKQLLMVEKYISNNGCFSFCYLTDEIFNSLSHDILNIKYHYKHFTKFLEIFCDHIFISTFIINKLLSNIKLILIENNLTKNEINTYMMIIRSNLIANNQANTEYYYNKHLLDMINLKVDTKYLFYKNHDPFYDKELDSYVTKYITEYINNFFKNIKILNNKFIVSILSQVMIELDLITLINEYKMEIILYHLITTPEFLKYLNYDIVICCLYDSKINYDNYNCKKIIVRILNTNQKKIKLNNLLQLIIDNSNK